MADNVAITAGSGTTIATDDIAGTHYQRVKLVDGTLDATGAIPGDATNGLQVNVTKNVPGTGATNLGKAEDAVHTTGDTGIAAWGVALSDANALTLQASATGDYSILAQDARGVLQVVARPYVLRTRVAIAGLTTVTTTYTVGDQAGTMLSFTNAAKVTGGTGMIQSITLLDKGDVGSDYRIHFWRSNVTLAADNAAFSVSDADMQDWIGAVVMPTMADLGANRATVLGNAGLGYDTGAGTTLYASVETRAANAVYAAATDLNLTLHLYLD